jgi:hypothetical protein
VAAVAIRVEGNQSRVDEPVEVVPQTEPAAREHLMRSPQMERHVDGLRRKERAVGASGFRVASLREDQPARRVVHRRQEPLEQVRAEDDQIAVAREGIEHFYRYVAQYHVPEYEPLGDAVGHADAPQREMSAVRAVLDSLNAQCPRPGPDRYGERNHRCRGARSTPWH